jgi:hypothetical protein
LSALSPEAQATALLIVPLLSAGFTQAQVAELFAARPATSLSVPGRRKRSAGS